MVNLELNQITKWLETQVCDNSCLVQRAETLNYILNLVLELVSRVWRKKNKITRKRWVIIEREREREIKQDFPLQRILQTKMQKQVKKSNARNIARNIDK